MHPYHKGFQIHFDHAVLFPCSLSAIYCCNDSVGVNMGYLYMYITVLSQDSIQLSLLTNNHAEIKGTRCCPLIHSTAENMIFVANNHFVASVSGHCINYHDTVQ